MQLLERLVVDYCIRELRSHGFLLSVNDGEEETVTKSDDIAAVFGAMGTTDEDYLIACRPDGYMVGWVRFIWGNEPWTVINDFSTAIEGHIAKTSKLCTELDEGMSLARLREVLAEWQ